MLASTVTAFAKPALPAAHNIRKNLPPAGLPGTGKVSQAPPLSICISNTCELAGGVTLELYVESLNLYSAAKGNEIYFFGYVTGNPGIPSFAEPQWYVYKETEAGSVVAYYRNPAPNGTIPTSGWEAIDTNCPEFTITTGACPPAPFCKTTVHVTPAGNGAKDGSNWANALAGDRLPAALATACSGTTFLVGAGLYKPTTSTTDRTASFSIASGVEVYGGYTISGDAAIGRVISTSTGTPGSTTLSGDIDGNNILDDANSLHVVSFSNVSDATRLDGVVITGGYAKTRPADNRGGGINNKASGSGNSSNPTIINCMVDGNSSEGGGGLRSVAAEGATASPVILNCYFTSNTGSGDKGGAIQFSASGSAANPGHANPIIANTTFIRNTAFRGGAFGASTYFGEVKPVITNCRFLNNTGTNSSGAFSWFPYAGVISLTAVNCEFAGNTAPAGGVAYLDGCCGFNYGEGPDIANISLSAFRSCTFTGNTATTDGGVLYLDTVLEGINQTTITDCVFSNNTAVNGGVIYADASDSGTAVAGITGSVFTGNSASTNGGVIYGNYLTATLESSTLINNHSANRGGAIYGDYMTTTLLSSTLINNRSENRGGAIYSTNGSLTLTSSLVSQNTAVADGGGVYAIRGKAFVLNQTDILQNVSLQGLGGGIHSSNSLTITGGNIIGNRSSLGGGGLNANGLNTLLTGVTISQNTIGENARRGGGVAASEVASIQFQNCIISRNTSYQEGAGVGVDFAENVSFDNTLFDQNTGNSQDNTIGGGGFSARYPTTARFTSCTFTGNTNTLGGSISVPARSTLTVNNSTFSGNTATGTANLMGGGAIFAATPFVNISGSRFYRNTANGAETDFTNTAGGGAILVSTTAVGVSTIRSSTFTENVATAGSGGAILVKGADGAGLLLDNVILNQNTATAKGGALFDKAVSLTAVNSAFTGNTASGGGGGAHITAPYMFSLVQWQTNTPGSGKNGGALFIDQYNSGNIVGNLFQQNGSDNSGPGGAVYANGGNHILINTNLNRNRAEVGGAISAGASFTLINCTINRNTARSGGTVFSGGEGANFAVFNSIIRNNADAAANFNYLSEQDVMLQNSLIDPASTTYTDAGNNRTADPLFTNEANNDLTLLACSPAINSGSNDVYTAANGPATDLANATRPFNTTIDMGAYEFQGTPSTLTATISGNQTICQGVATTLTAQGGSSFTWSTGETTAAITVSPTSTTAYSVTVSSGGCSATTTATITVNSSPTVTISPSATTLTGGQSVTLTASGAASYTWSTGASTTAITVSPATTTDYAVTASNGGSCVATATAAVSVSCNPAQVAQVSSFTQTAVLGPDNCSVKLTGSGYGNSFIFEGPAFVYSQVYRRTGTYTVSAVNVKTPGTYSLKASYTNACGETFSDTMTYVVTGEACK